MAVTLSVLMKMKMETELEKSCCDCSVWFLMTMMKATDVDKGDAMVGGGASACGDQWRRCWIDGLWR